MSPDPICTCAVGLGDAANPAHVEGCAVFGWDFDHDRAYERRMEGQPPKTGMENYKYPDAHGYGEIPMSEPTVERSPAVALAAVVDRIESATSGLTPVQRMYLIGDARLALVEVGSEPLTDNHVQHRLERRVVEAARAFIDFYEITAENVHEAGTPEAYLFEAVDALAAATEAGSESP